MNREEALAAGHQVQATIHHMKRRAPWHDYRHPGYYMLTLVVEGRRPFFGRVLSVPRDSVAGFDAGSPTSSQ